VKALSSSPSMAGVGGKGLGNGGTRWKLEAERDNISLPGAFKTYANPWEGRTW
jgi:hypothetical protein